MIANDEIHVTLVCDLMLFIYFFCHMLFIVSICNSLERYYGNFKILQPLLTSTGIDKGGPGLPSGRAKIFLVKIEGLSSFT